MNKFEQKLVKSFLALLGAGTGIVALSNCLYNVDGGYRAVKFSRIQGVVDKVYKEGTHLLIPWIEYPIIYDARAKPRNIASLTGTKDLQMVDITLRVLSKPNVDKLPTIFRELGVDYDERVLPSIANEVLKSVVAQFNASQLITQRDKVSRLVRQRLVDRASQFNIVLDDVSITHVKFGPEFTAAVESKQIAQQEAQRAAFVVERAKQDKQSVIVRAEGEALSAKMIGEAIASNPAFMELRKIEAARDIAKTISDSKNKIYLNAESLLLGLPKIK